MLPRALGTRITHVLLGGGRGPQYHCRAGQQKLRQCKATDMLEASAQPAPVAVHQELPQCFLSQPCQSNKRAAKGHPWSEAVNHTRRPVATHAVLHTLGRAWSRAMLSWGVASPTGNCTQLQGLIRCTHTSTHKLGLAWTPTASAMLCGKHDVTGCRQPRAVPAVQHLRRKAPGQLPSQGSTHHNICYATPNGFPPSFAQRTL